MIIIRLILTRHGETIHNVERLITGQSVDDELNDRGINQAKRLAERLKNHNIDVIYSSDLGRAADTAAEIAKKKGLEIHFSKELRERNVGIYEGKKLTEEEFEEFLIILRDPDASIKNGESLKDSVDRAECFIQHIIKDHPNETVLIVAHAAIGEAMIAAITKIPLEKVKEIGDFHNTAVNIFDIDEDRNHKIILRNCTKHLD